MTDENQAFSNNSLHVTDGNALYNHTPKDLCY